MATHNKVNRSTVLSDALSSCRGVFIAIFTFSLFVNLFSLVLPLFLLQLYDRVIPNHSSDTLVMLTIVVFIALVANSGLEAVRTTLLTRTGNWLDQRLSGLVMSGTIEKARRDGKNSVQGLRDLAMVRQFITGPNLLPILDAPWTPIFIAVLFLLHPVIGYITLAGAFILLGLAFLNEFITRTPAKISSDTRINVYDEANSVVRNAEVINAMGMRDSIVNRWLVSNDKALSLQTSLANRTRIVSSIAKFTRWTLQVIVMSTAAWFILNGEMTAGALMACVLLMRRAISPVERSISAWKSVLNVRDALTRVDNHLKQSEKEFPLLMAPDGKFDVTGLRYYYPNASKPVLRKIAFELNPGEAIAIVGATGAGKSTLARLLVGNATPYRGHVRFGDIEITQWDPELLGPNIGYLPQSVALFKGSVGENIARMESTDSDSVKEAAIKAAELAGAHDMIMDFPEGYDTDIGEEGVMISGGQRQRIALARAVYRYPKLVVLDEPDAHLDRDGRKALSKVIGRLKTKDCMVVLITHQVKISENIDRILRMNQGMLENISAQKEHKSARSSR